MGADNPAHAPVSRGAMMGVDICNIAGYLVDGALCNPDKPAVIQPVGRDAMGAMAYDVRSFKQLDDESNRYANGFIRIGIARGDRTLVMIKPGFDFIAITFALFKLGAVPVLIDPGMGKSNLFDCVLKAGPCAMVAIPKAHLARLVWPRYFRSVKVNVTVGRRWFWGGASAERVRRASSGSFDLVHTAPADMAAILFTTGSTGPPKGVVYEHSMFDAQVKMIKERYNISEEDVDLPAFPLFALFSIAMGMSVVIPDMDPTRPARVDPAIIAEQINERGVTISFGSPAIWRRVSGYCVDRGVTLPTLKRVLMAGAPVDDRIHDKLLNHVLPKGADTYTPFGATESLPVCDMEGSEALEKTAWRTRKGHGVCVGRPLPGMTVKIIRITDEVIEQWDDSLQLPAGEAGEIVVSGPVVTKEYYNEPELTRMAVIRDGESGAVIRRMGDVGRMDDEGRLWFLGRKAHRVVTGRGTLFTIPCEAVFNQSANVFRCALVGLGKAPGQLPVIIVELAGDRPVHDKNAVVEELARLAEANRLTEFIKNFMFHPELPTDIRHNAKIFREKLKVWAQCERPDLVPGTGVEK